MVGEEGLMRAIICGRAAGCWEDAQGSIARAMGRKFIRISLGGIRDRRKYEGIAGLYRALPGRIIQGIRRWERRSVFMLDEVDKLAIGYQAIPPRHS